MVDTTPGRHGSINQISSFDFSCGWELDSQGRRRAMLYENGLPTDLGALSSNGDSEARAVDFAGNVAGWSEKVVNGGLRKQPFLWNAVDGMRALPMNNGIEGWAEDMGVYGFEVAGTARLFDGTLRGFEYLEGVTPVIETLPTLGGWESEAFAIDDGFVGGLMRDPSGREYALIWDRLRDPWFLPTPGTGDARVTDIAINGRVCGWFEDAQGNRQGFLANAHAPTDPIQILPTLGGAWTEALALDGGNRVVGSSADAQGQARAFLYEIFEDRMIDLNERAAHVPGRIVTRAQDIEFQGRFAVEFEDQGTIQGGRGQMLTLFHSGATEGARMLVNVGNAPAFTQVAFVWGLQAGQTAVPGCPGLFADIDRARVAGFAEVSEWGSASRWFDVPANTAGTTIFLQAVLPQACLTTITAETVIH